MTNVAVRTCGGREQPVLFERANCRHFLCVSGAFAFNLQNDALCHSAAPPATPPKIEAGGGGFNVSASQHFLS